MTSMKLDRFSGPLLRNAAIGGLAFTILYLLHRVLQGTGPDRSTAAAVAAYHVVHRGALVASEVAVGLALLAFIPFLAALVPVIWRAGQETLAVAVAISGSIFVAMGFVSNAAETALIGVADSNQPAAGRTGPGSAAGPYPDRVDDHGAGRGALAGDPAHQPGRALARRGGLGRRGSLPAGLHLQRPGTNPRRDFVPCRVGIFIVWMLLFSVGLWRTAATTIAPRS